MWKWNPFKKRILKFKSLVIENKYKIEPAFVLGGKQYYQFSNTMDMPAARGLSAMSIYEEFRLKADKEYLEKHVKATNLILNGDDKGKIDLNLIRQINYNLGERIGLAALPDYCYRLASVHFFDAEESVHIYDEKYNAEKIKLWKENPDVLGFFLTQPLKDFLPFSNMPKATAEMYLNVGEKIAQSHLNGLLDILSKKA